MQRKPLDPAAMNEFLKKRRQEGVNSDAATAVSRRVAIAIQKETAGLDRFKIEEDDFKVITIRRSRLPTDKELAELRERAREEDRKRAPWWKKLYRMITRA